MEYEEINETIIDFGKQAPKSVYKRGLEIFISTGHLISIEEEIVYPEEGSF